MKCSRSATFSAFCLNCILIFAAVTPLSAQVRKDDGQGRANVPETLAAKVGDLDGDGRADLALFVAPFTWFVRNTSGQSPCNYTSTYTTSTFDLATTTPVAVPGDYNNDLRTDLAVYESFPNLPNSPAKFSVAYIPSTPLPLTPPLNALSNFGFTTDVPLMGDFNGDGFADYTVVRSVSNQLYWYVQDSVTHALILNGQTWGTKRDYLIPMDYDGDHKTDLVVWRLLTGDWWISTSTSNYTNVINVQWGAAGDIPLLGDFTGDARDDVAVFRPSTGVWYIRETGPGTATAISWGTTGDIPVPADYDGNGKSEVAVYRPGTATWHMSTCPAQVFLVPGSNFIPVPSLYVKQT